jgi:hypothetical protein
LSSADGADEKPRKSRAVVWIAAITALAGLTAWRALLESARSMPESLGWAFVVTLGAAFVAWLVHRVGGRSVTLGLSVFGLLLLTVLAYDWIGVQRRQLGGVPTLEPLGPGGLAQGFARARARVERGVQSRIDEWREKRDAFRHREGFDPESVGSAAEVDARLVELAELRKATSTAVDASSSVPRFLGDYLESEEVSFQERRELMSPAIERAERRYDRLSLEIEELDALREIYWLMRKRADRWRRNPGSGELEFLDVTVETEFANLMLALDEVLERKLEIMARNLGR